VDEAITGGLSSPTKAAVARKTKTRVVDDGDGDLSTSTSTSSARIVCEPNGIRRLFLTRQSEISHFIIQPSALRACGATFKGRVQNSDGANHRHTREIERLNAEHIKWFAQYALELTQGFNLCFYGTAQNVRPSTRLQSRNVQQGVTQW